VIRTELIAPISRLLAKHAEEQPSKLAFSDDSTQVTYAELARLTTNLAGQLQALGVQTGESVGLFLPNGVNWVIACLAIVRAGAVCVPISYDATQPEIAYRLEDAKVKVLIASAYQAQVLESLISIKTSVERVIQTDRQSALLEGATHYPHIDKISLDYESLINAQPGQAARDSDDIDRVSFIIYTSGTTGRAKGVLLTQRGMLWVTAACWAPIAGLGPQDAVLSPLPLFHSYALNLSVLSIVAAGASEHILKRFSTAEVLRLLQTGRYTVLPGVPTMFHYLLEAVREQPDVKFPNLRLCISAGAIMPGPINQEFENRFGVKLLDGYGITETSTMVTMNWQQGGRVMGSCGLPVPGLTVRLINPADGHDVPFGQEGELIVRGPNVMLGYHNKPAETAVALKAGWYYTGDLAKCDASGFLTITGRLKELVIRGGQNIAPAEVEEAVCSHETVLDCAVVGAPHEYLGEVPVVFVVARPGMQVEPQAVIEHCRERLSAYKVPAAVHLVTEIPRTGSGKIIRFKLKETLNVV
jgi:acyl-CoA synthetase (AMP-forming)/AMP-acid ligase II